MFIEKVTKALKAHPPDKLLCLQPAPVQDGGFCIFEASDKRSCVVAKEEEVQLGRDYLLVHTASDLPIWFIAVDRCLIKTGKRCDAALCREAEVVLIDLKLDTTNREPRERTTEGFHAQMKGTIDYLQGTLNIAMRDFSVRLCIVFPVATITTTMNAELLRLESDIHNQYNGLDVQYFLLPDAPSMGMVPVLAF
jgi:hypothetical protein